MAEKNVPGKESEEKTYIKAMGLIGETGTGGSTIAVDVKDGKIVRLRPLHYDWKYKLEEFGLWEIHARGKVFRPCLKTLPSPHSLGYKKRVYSPNRVLHPLKRVDWDPNGERNTENRGVSKYVQVSWDEALDIITSELKRVQKKYGPSAVLLRGDGHGETGVVNPSHGCPALLLKHMGGYTLQSRNPDSWEGFYWGGKHAWGMDPVGVEPQINMIPDIAESCELILYWGGDPETTPWAFHGQIQSRVCYWLSELGIKNIYICPDLNYGAAVHADKWIPILPNTDAAMQLAIAYTWLTEDTYDKEYIKTHTIGFDKLKDYVLGKEDGIPKTPKWAAELCGVPSRIIKALARQWVSKVTSIAHGNGGSYIRGPYSTEPARLEVVLLAMQGLGKPGRNQVKMMEWGFFGRPHEMPIPLPVVMPQVFACYKGFDVTKYPKQIIPKDLVHNAILNAPISWYGTTLLAEKTENQFKKYTYPVEGCSEIHMIWTDSPCWITCWNGGNKCIDAFRSPQIEFIVAQHIWLENDCLFADVILPAHTKFEELDIGVDGIGGQYRTIEYEGQCIESLGESKSDWEIALMVADRFGLREKLTQGKSIEEWMKIGFEHSGLPEAGLCTWEKLKENQYYVVPTDPNWAKRSRGLQDFYEDPEKYPLTTPTGKLEIYSEKLAKFFPDDEERPPYPKWIPYGESHQESLLCERAKKYPILVCSNHPRWGVHANHDDITWFREIKTCKIRGADGYQYHTMWIHPEDAEARGIEDGDVVNMYNERGGVLAGAYVTERIMPGVISIDHGAKYDPIVPGELDRGGAINTITPGKVTSPNATGMVTSGFLVEVERVNLDELRKKYPEAFSRPFHPTAGPGTESFILGGKK